jgi:uncharacterized protein involved in tellurium resistance
MPVSLSDIKIRRTTYRIRVVRQHLASDWGEYHGVRQHLQCINGSPIAQRNNNAQEARLMCALAELSDELLNTLDCKIVSVRQYRSV